MRVNQSRKEVQLHQYLYLVHGMEEDAEPRRDSHKKSHHKWRLSSLFGSMKRLDELDSNEKSGMLYCNCSHKRKVNAYCVDHDELLCEPCKVIQHSKCQTPSLRKKISEFTTSKLDATIKRAINLKDKFGSINHEGKSHICELDNIKEICRQDIKAFRQDLNAFLDNLEEKILKDLDDCEKDQCQFIEERVSTLSDKLQALDADHNTLVTTKAEGKRETMFAVDFTISKHLQDYEIFCDEVAAEIQAVTIIFAKSEKLEALQNVITSMGTLFTNEQKFIERNTDPLSSSLVEVDTHLSETKRELQKRAEQALQQYELEGSSEQIRQIKDQLQHELLLQSREAQARLEQKHRDQVRENHMRQAKMRQDTIQQEKLRLEEMQKQQQESQKEQKRKEQIRQEQLQKEQELQAKMRERREKDRKLGQEKIQTMLQEGSQYEQSRQETLRQKHIRQELSRQEQMKEQERLAKLRQSQQEELRQSQMRQNQLRKERLQDELNRQKEVQEEQQQKRQAYLVQSQQEQAKQEQLRQEKLKQEQLRQEKIRQEKIRQHQEEEAMRQAREEHIRKEKQMKEEARQEQLRQEHMQQEKLEEERRQLREEQIRRVKEDQERQAKILEQLYKQIKHPDSV